MDINYIPEKSNNSILGNGCVKPTKKSQFEKSYNSEGNLYLAPPTFQNIIFILSRNNISQHALRIFNLEHLHVDDEWLNFDTNIWSLMRTLLSENNLYF